MDDLFYWGNLILSYGITGYVMLKFMQSMFVQKYHKNIFLFATYILFILISVIINLIGNPILKTIYGIVSICLISFLLFTEKPKKKMIVYDLVFFLYIIWMDGISVLVVAFITNSTILIVKENINLIFLSGISSQILILCTYRLIIVFFKRHSIKSIALQQNLFLIILALFEIMLVTYMMLEIEANSQGGILIFVIMCLLGIDIYLIYLFEAISQKYELEKEINLREQQTLMQNNYYSSIETQYEHSRRLIHDIKNHILTLEELYNRGEREEAGLYTQVVMNTMDTMGSRFKCNNKVLTIIINDKLLKCDDNKIIANIEVENLELDFIDPFDITTIFSNLLDNAIEACEEIEFSKRKIDLKLARFNNFIMINIKNSCNSELNFDAENTVSTKKGSHMGIGLKNVNSTIEKYNGSIQYSNSKDIFEVKILLTI